MDHYVNMSTPFAGLEQATTAVLDAFENWTGWKLGIGRDIIEMGASPGLKVIGPGLIGKVGKNFTKNVGKIAQRFGKSEKEINKAIHAAKRQSKYGNKVRNNPDVEVDLNNGDIYLAGEYINNIFDYLK